MSDGTNPTDASTDEATRTQADASLEAIADYDAEQLVAFRAEHRADDHDPTHCLRCKLIERRLGTL